MMLNSDYLLKEIDKNRQFIEQYPLEAQAGTKKMLEEYHSHAVEKRNQYIESQIELFTQYKQILYYTLNDRMKALLPQDKTSYYERLHQRLLNLEQVVSYDNPYNRVIDKLGLSTLLSQINDTNHIDLDAINDVILQVIRKLREASITIRKEDFYYSMFTYQYMDYFFQYMMQEDFHQQMRTVFENIYWDCPMLITHLKLNIYFLFQKYSKELTTFCTKEKNRLFSENNITTKPLDEYKRVRNQLEEEEASDSNLILHQFMNEEISFDDYLLSNPECDKRIQKFMTTDTPFLSLSTEEKESFFQLLINLDQTLDELESYYQYQYILKDIVTKYRDKDKIKGVLQAKEKEIQKEEKKRQKILQKYLKLQNKHSIFKKKSKVKLNAIKMEMNTQLSVLAGLYEEIKEARFNDRLIQCLDDASVISQAFCFASSFYPHLKKVITTKNQAITDEELEQEIHSFFAFCYHPNHTFIKKINMLNEVDITEMVAEKYRLLNLKLEVEDLTSENIGNLRADLKKVLKIYYIEKGELSLEQMKLIVQVSKLPLPKESLESTDENNELKQ